MQQKQLPIGYYLKLANNLLTEKIDEIQAQHSLNRVEWQVLNTISEKLEISKNEVLELMKPLGDNQTIKSIFTKFVADGNIEATDNKLTLTTQGKFLHRSCFDTQQKLRKKAVTDI